MTDDDQSDRRRSPTTHRRRGRPCVAPDRKRRHPVTCRLTDAEAKHVDGSRGAVTRGEFIRRAALAAPPQVVPEINRQAWIDLARLSGNLNQIAHHLNERRGLDPCRDIDALVLTLPDLRAAVDGLRASMIGLDLHFDEDDDGEG